jgi:hypothetical protein
VSSFDDFISGCFREVSVYPVVYGGGGEVELVCDLGHGKHVGALKVFQDFLSVVTVIAAIVRGGFADLVHFVISDMVLLK